MVFSVINGNDTMQVIQQVNDSTNYFNWVLLAVYLVFGIFFYSAKDRRGGSSEIFASFTVAGILVTVIGALLFAIELISIGVLQICIAITILTMILNIFTE